MFAGPYDPPLSCRPDSPVLSVNQGSPWPRRFLLPIHHRTFRLSEEPMDEPIQRLEKVWAASPDQIAVRKIGETFEVPEVVPVGRPE